MEGKKGSGHAPLPQIALPVFGYKSHISIDWRFGLIRGASATSAAEAKLTLANLAYNFDRLIFHETRAITE